VIFVTHDIGVAVEVADRIAVMYAGRIIESGPSGPVIRTPAHPYTQGLLAARTTRVFAKGGRLEAIPGSPPDLRDPPAGCAFAPRCKRADKLCSAALPPEIRLAADHFARCIKLEATPAGH
jgi:peptide/nickel transport system ATP-binding protein